MTDLKLLCENIDLIKEMDIPACLLLKLKAAIENSGCGKNFHLIITFSPYL